MGGERETKLPRLALVTPFEILRKMFNDGTDLTAGIDKNYQNQEKIRGQREKLPVQPLGYVNSTKVIHGGALERKYVFRDVRIKADHDLMFLVKAK